MLAGMKCPHCQQGIQEVYKGGGATVEAGDAKWTLNACICPLCSGPIIRVLRQPSSAKTPPELIMAYPHTDSLRPVPTEVPDPYREDFTQACAVLSFSPMASAALSRRNLQAILRDRAGTKKKDLFDQIEEVIASGKIPSHIADDLHAVRNIGNFAAHEIKSKITGAIVEVETGEAEWNLDVLESLFDFYFVEPTKAAKRRAELNKKLKEAGKPELT
jgi:hypothetical protein